MELARRPKVEFEELAKTIEQDSLLAAKVMTRAESVMYSGQNPVRSLRQAAVRMGVGGLRDLVIEVAMNLRVFRSPGLEKQMETLRRHSLATAHTARLVCRYASLDGEYAFLCGLLHDVGIAAILVAIGEGALKSRPKNPIALWSAIDSSHEESGATIAKLWKLPEELALVIGAHHHPVQGGYVHPLIAVICVAQDLAGQIGASMDGVMPGEEEQRKAESVGDHTPREALLRARFAPPDSRAGRADGEGSREAQGDPGSRVLASPGLSQTRAWAKTNCTQGVAVTAVASWEVAPIECAAVLAGTDAGVPAAAALGTTGPVPWAGAPGFASVCRLGEMARRINP